MAYINPSQIRTSFAKLATRTVQGKTHSERTSVILYFLAFDATCKRIGSNSLDFDYGKREGKTNRCSMETEFSRLSLVAYHQNGAFQITEFGKINLERKLPETRISSNFFTVPLKKASTQNTICSYPKRPSTPVLNMGRTNTTTSWGITYHPNWRNNLPKLFSKATGSTHFTDLAICVFRDSQMTNGDIHRDLEILISERFSSELADFWNQRIQKERLLWQPNSTEIFVDCHTNTLHELALQSVNPYELLSKNQLIEKILELEKQIQTFKLGTNN